MEVHQDRIKEVNIDEAINITSGTRKYQQFMVLILLLGLFSVSPIIMTSSFFLPQPSDSWFSNSASYELAPLWEDSNQVVAFRTIYFLGVIVGCLILPWLADKYGRKKVIEKSLILGTFSMGIAALSINMIMMCIAGFFIGTMYVACNIIGFVLCMESLDFKYRNYYLGFYQLAWPVGSAFSTALYWSGLYWRYTILISAGILLLEIYLLAYVAESPRFLLTNIFNVKGCQKLMNRISLINGEGNFSYTLISENTNKLKLSIGDLFCSKWIVFRIAICTLLWFSVVFGYYSMIFLQPNKGLTIFLKSDDNSDIFLRSIVNNIINTISVCILYVPLINYFGRKKIAFFSLVLDGVLFLSFSFLLYFQSNDNMLIYIFFSVARFLLDGQFTLFYIYTSELFPTYIRCTCLGIVNIFGRIGGILAVNLSINTCNSALIPIPIITGILAILIAPLIVCLEETHHKELDEMIEIDYRGEPLLDKNSF